MAYERDPHWSYRPSEGMFGESIISKEERTRQKRNDEAAAAVARIHKESDEKYIKETIKKAYDQMRTPNVDIGKTYAELTRLLHKVESSKEYKEWAPSLERTRDDVSRYMYEAKAQSVEPKPTAEPDEIVEYYDVREAKNQKLKQKYRDETQQRQIIARVEALLAELELDYRRQKSPSGDQWVLKTIRDYNELIDMISRIDDAKIAGKYNKFLEHSALGSNPRDPLRGSHNSRHVESYIKGLYDEVEMDPDRYQKADLIRARSGAEYRLGQLGGLQRITQARKLKQATTAEELDSLYRDDNLVYTDDMSKGRSR